MSISLPIPAGLSEGTLGTYNGLVSAIPEWVKDSSISARINDMIQLAEDDFRTRVFHPYREGVATLVASSSVALPLDFLAPRAVWLETDPRQKIEPMTPGNANTYWTFTSVGRPLNYEIVGEELWLSPAPDDAYSLKLIYSRDLTPLSNTNQSNWLIEKFPAAYFYGVLMQAEFFGWNDERIPLIKAALDEKIDGINAEGNRRRFATPIRMRASSYA
jgi:hypothetical protein